MKAGSRPPAKRGGERRKPPRRASGGPRRSPAARRRPRRLRLRLGLWSLLVAAASLALATVAFWVTVFVLEQRLPDVSSLDDYRHNALQVTRVLSADGVLIDEVFDERRTVVDTSALPTFVTGAVLAAEDSGFRQHPGIDLWGVLRALWVNLRAGEVRQGGSTITQQVAKTFFLSPERSLLRKLNELVLARRLELRLSKDAILDLYLNQIYFGHGRWGIEEAARFYFGKPARELDVHEAALLAGLIRAPERLTPLRHPEAARARRDHVLGRMADEGFLSADEAARARDRPLGLRPSREGGTPRAGYFAARVRAELAERLGHERLRRGGLTVHTSLNARTQRAAEAAVAEGLRGTDASAGFAAPLRRLSRAELRRALASLGRGGAAFPAAGRIVEGLVSRVAREAGYYEVALPGGVGRLSFDEEARYRAEESPGTLYAVGDVLRVSARLDQDQVARGASMPLNLEQGPQAALVALAHDTGEVLALVGGDDVATRPFDRASHARRQAGSTFKPIVFAAALDRGDVRPEERFPNEQRSYRGADGRPWSPSNFDGVHDGAQVTLGEALARSLNVVAVQVLRRVGVEAAISLARRLGIEGPLPKDLTLALGSGAVSPLELTRAYASFSTGGRLPTPRLVLRVLDGEGREIYRAPRLEMSQVMAAPTAASIQAMLREAVAQGTGRRAQVEGLGVGGKTGTAQDGVDAWFVGFAGPWTVGVWMGFDDNRPLGGTGGSLAAPLWADFLRRSL